jgi:hypothetical protein
MAAATTSKMRIAAQIDKPEERFEPPVPPEAEALVDAALVGGSG